MWVYISVRVGGRQSEIERAKVVEDEGEWIGESNREVSGKEIWEARERV